MSRRDNNEGLDHWQLIEQSLSQLSTRLDRIETRLNQLETQRDRQVVLNERRSIDDSGFGSREISTTPQGAIQRDILIGVCDICKKRLYDDEAFRICSSCGRRLCASPSQCSVIYQNKTICIECLKTRFIQLNKTLYKTLVCTANEVSSTTAISEITHSVEEEVRSALKRLIDLGLITKRGFFVFSAYQVTARGMEAIALYRQVWGSDYDTLVFDAELRRYILQKSGVVL